MLWIKTLAVDIINGFIEVHTSIQVKKGNYYDNALMESFWGCLKVSSYIIVNIKLEVKQLRMAA